MVEHRRGWTNGISASIKKIRNMDLRGVIEETWTRMRYRKGGEMAMMGCFQPRWVDSIYKGRMPFQDGEDRVVRRIFKEIGEGARKMINFYYSQEKGMLLGVELRQTNIRGFYGRSGRGIDMPPGVVKRGTVKKKPRLKEKEPNKEGAMNVGYIVFMDGNVIYWEFKKG